MKKLVRLSFFLSILFLSGCEDKNQAAQQAQGPLPFPVVEIPSRTVTGFTSYPVRVEGTVNSAVRPKVSGYITDVLVDEGEQVNEGQLLFTLETKALNQDAGAAKANVNAAQVEVEKLKPLVEKGIISDVQLQTAKARLAQAQASYESIAANIGYASIKSPVDGYVGAINYREGALVSPGDPRPLTTVSDIDNVYTFFSMNEEEYLDFVQNAAGESLSEKIKSLPPVKLELVNGELYEEEGEIQTVTGQVDRSTGTVSFRAAFPNTNRLLANGSSGTILIPKVYENVPVVPESSTYEEQGNVYVFKVVGDTLATPAIIEVRDRIQNLIIAGQGIEEGDRIIAEGVGRLRGPTPVTPQVIAFDSIANSINTVFK